MAVKFSPLDFIRFANLMKEFIGPAVELVEILKEAFKSKEQKFIDIALKAFGNEELAEAAQAKLIEAIKTLQIGLPCLEQELDGAPLIDCLVNHIEKNIRSKKLRNKIFLELALEMAIIAAPEKYKELGLERWKALVEKVYSKKKNGGFKFLVNG